MAPLLGQSPTSHLRIAEPSCLLGASHASIAESSRVLGAFRASIAESSSMEPASARAKCLSLPL